LSGGRDGLNGRPYHFLTASGDYCYIGASCNTHTEYQYEATVSVAVPHLSAIHPNHLSATGEYAGSARPNRHTWRAAAQTSEHSHTTAYRTTYVATNIDPIADQCANKHCSRDGDRSGTAHIATD
jgi:hypothetical protein